MIQFLLSLYSSSRAQRVVKFSTGSVRELKNGKLIGVYFNWKIDYRILNGDGGIRRIITCSLDCQIECD
jgi:hypothetical protein